MLQELKQKNPQLTFYSIRDPKFAAYGKILDINRFSEIVTYIDDHTTIPEKENQYVAHDPKMQLSLTNLSAYHDVFGDMPVEFGYVNGQNQKLNALEYHKSSEINIAITPFVLLIGSASDIQHKSYDSSQLLAFYVPEHTAIEIFPRTLHFSPCKVLESGFKCGVILPYGTNMNFIHAKVLDSDESYLLFKTNKWLLAHPEHEKMISQGAHAGLVGTNYEIKY